MTTKLILAKTKRSGELRFSASFVLFCYFLEIIESGFNCGDALLHPLELKREPSVVAGILKYLDAGVDGYYSVTNNGAAEIVSACGSTEALGLDKLAASEKEILCMNVEGVGSGNSNRANGIGIGADEITHINKPSVILAINGEDKLLHTLGSLEDLAMVLCAGSDTLASGVFGNATDVWYHILDGISVIIKGLLGKHRAYVVTHNLRAKRLGDINTIKEIFDHTVNIVGKQVGGHCVGYDLKTDLITVGLDLFGSSKAVGGNTELILIEIDKLDTVEADLLC